MTLCIGIERKGRVWIGADSAMAHDDLTSSARAPKIWRSGGWLIAAAGLWRTINVVRLAAKFPPAEGANESTVALTITSEIRRVLEAHSVSVPEFDDGEQRFVERATDWLVAAPRVGLWTIDGEFDAHRMTEWAIGFNEYAFGWLDASQLEAPEARIRGCIAACSKRMPGAVRLPVTVLEA